MKFVYKNHTVSVVASKLADGSGWVFTNSYYSDDEKQLNVRSDYGDSGHKFNTEKEAEQAGAAAARAAIDRLISGAPSRTPPKP